ncbi:MAG: Rab family GTPase [Candidatus Thorarchaeota archaeon]
MAEQVRLVKIVLAGDGAVGKTSLRERYLGHGFRTEYLQTMGADFALHETKIDNERIRWQIWDLAGQPLFANVVKTYYQGSYGAVIVYDVTRPETLEKIKDWAEDIWANTTYAAKVPFVLLGNKVDLKDQIVLTTDAGTKVAHQLAEARGGPVPHFETSARTGVQVDEAFEELGRLIFKFTEELPEED